MQVIPNAGNTKYCRGADLQVCAWWTLAWSWIALPPLMSWVAHHEIAEAQGSVLADCREELISQPRCRPHTPLSMPLCMPLHNPFHMHAFFITLFVASLMFLLMFLLMPLLMTSLMTPGGVPRA